MIKFRDLYNAIKNTETAYDRMGLDIDNAKCGMPKCVLSEGQEKLIQSYLDLANIDVDFCELDFQAVIQKIDECFQCVTDEFAGLLPPPLPEPEQGVNSCSGTTVIPLGHIKRFRIYERTYTSPSIPSAIQVYLVTKASLPYTFTPSVPESVSSHEKYYVSWNPQRNALRVKVDHDKFPESMGAPDGSYNIARIVAEIDDEYQGIYGMAETQACMAFLMTPDVKWKANYGLEKAVDNDPSSYTSVDGSPPEVVVEFVFAV